MRLAVGEGELHLVVGIPDIHTELGIASYRGDISNSKAIIPPFLTSDFSHLKTPGDV